jgi:regulator of sigma E protease
MGILLGLIGIGIMVFVHELGHFVAARLAGVEVEVLSLGWGPRLIGFKRGNTWYQVSWLLLIGGYCKMKGELVPSPAGGGQQEGRPAAAEEPAAAPVHPKGSFLAASPLQRIMISAFGPLFNLAFAFVVFALIAWIGYSFPSSESRVVLATDYTLDTFPQPPPATLAGLRTGDRIVSIDGKPVATFQDILESVQKAAGRTLAVGVQRAAGGARETLAMTPQLDKDTGAGRIGIYAWIDPVVKSVVPNSAAAIDGVQPGDVIVEAGGRPVANSIDMSEALSKAAQKLAIVVVRAGARQPITLVMNGPDPGVVYAIALYHSPALGLAGAVAKSADDTWNTVTETVKGIGLLFQGVNWRRAVMGPLGITKAIGAATTGGYAYGGVGGAAYWAFELLAVVSIALFMMNLLPIPALDGGQIILFIAEAIRGRAVSTRVIWRLQIVGFSLLIFLFLFASANDLGLFGR